jgi:hypothetical protein
MAAGDARREIIGASAGVRDDHEGQAGIGVAEIERQVGRVDLPEGLLQAAQGICQ